MTIEIRIPVSVDRVKEAFENGDLTIALTMASDCLKYLKAVREFSKWLIRDIRIDSRLASELKNIENHSIRLALEMTVLCRKYKPEYDFEWLP